MVRNGDDAGQVCYWGRITNGRLIIAFRWFYTEQAMPKNVIRRLRIVSFLQNAFITAVSVGEPTHFSKR
jgi:hypothetical protein